MWVGIILYLILSNSFTVWDNYLPPAIVTMSTITQNNKKEIVVKIGALLHESGFLVYYLVNRVPFSSLRQVILVIACLIGIILLIKNRMKKEEEKIVVEELE